MGHLDYTRSAGLNCTSSPGLQGVPSMENLLQRKPSILTVNEIEVVHKISKKNLLLKEKCHKQVQRKIAEFVNDSDLIFASKEKDTEGQ
mmetsp:Transcript_7434/g.8414  ORF Transcript_7434/g.8414 Transcript_7434/m.8414 type:complete len:89 (-) Transcript_7434:249-515(-)